MWVVIDGLPLNDRIRSSFCVKLANFSRVSLKNALKYDLSTYLSSQLLKTSKFTFERKNRIILQFLSLFKL